MDDYPSHVPAVARRRISRAGLLRAVATVLLTLAVVAGVGAYLVKRNGTRTWIVERLGGSLGPPPPTVNPGKVDTSLRQVLLADRDRAVARGDLAAARRSTRRSGRKRCSGRRPPSGRGSASATRRPSCCPSGWTARSGSTRTARPTASGSSSRPASG
jgi:hypothetical protein